MLLLAPEPLPLEPLPLEPLAPSPVSFRRRRVLTKAMLVPHDTEPHDDSRCRYPSKVCFNLRVRKASGALHRYCEYHRDKANANQKRWVGRQRGASPTSSPAASPTAKTTQLQWIAPAPAEPMTKEMSAATLSDEDWDALLALLAPPEPSTKGPPSTTPRCRRQRSTAALSRARRSPLE